MAQQGHLHRCPHLVGVPLPRWPQVTPSESCWDSQKRAETPATGSSEPSIRATVAPVQETPAEEPPIAETPVTKTPATCSDIPAPMETGGVGDSQSWAKQVEAGIEAEFQQDRPVKRHRSQSRKREVRPMLPFPSKTVREGLPLFCSSTSMWGSSQQLATMWPAEGSYISIRRWCRKRPGTSEIR